MSICCNLSMRARECRSRCGPAAYTFPSPCHPLGRAGTGAWRRAPLPNGIKGASHLRPILQGNHSGRDRGRRGGKVFEKCVAHQNNSLTGFNNAKKGVGCKGVFLRVRDEKTSETEGKRESEAMGSWWQYLLREREPSISFFFFKPVLSSSESWND